MEESKKKPIMIGVIVTCLVLAFAIYISRNGSSGSSDKPAKAILVKCSNQDCEAEYQIDRKVYNEHLKKHRGLQEMPPMVCKKCEEKSAFRAVKCEKCELVFFRGAVADDYADRCPGCGHSKTEEEWERTGGGE